MSPVYLARIMCGTLDLFLKLWEIHGDKTSDIHYALTKAHEAVTEYRDSVTQPEL